MQIIKSKKKDTFDKIIDGLDKNLKERELLLMVSISFNIIMSKHINYTDNQMRYLNSLNAYIKEAMDINNKEVDIYNKMLRYLQLLITNDRYYWYSESYYYDYFEEIIKFLSANRHNRLVKDSVLLCSVSMGMRFDSDSVTIAGDQNAIENMLTDDVYKDILSKIPKR